MQICRDCGKTGDILAREIMTPTPRTPVRKARQIRPDRCFATALKTHTRTLVFVRLRRSWQFWVFTTLLFAIRPAAIHAQAIPDAPAPTSHTLRLVEKGSYVELPPDVFNDFTEATVEAWVKWNAFGNRYQRIFNYGAGGRDFSLTTLTSSNTLWFVIVDPADGMKVAEWPNSLRAGEWTHVAGVAGSGGMKLYLNGTLVATNPYSGCFQSLGPGNANRLGQTVTADVDDTPFDGELAEVRVWKAARSEEQIRDNMAKTLTGNEEGLAALWNFADPTNPGLDASPNHHDGKLIGNSRAERPSIAATAAATAAAAAAAAEAATATSAVAVPRAVPFAGTSNQVLVLEGRDSFVELPANIFNGLTSATVEGWIRWDRLQQWERFFDFGRQPRSINVRVPSTLGTLGAAVDEKRPAGVFGVYPIAERVLQPQQWVHIALIMDGREIQLLLNGVVVASRPCTESFAYILGGEHNYLGKSNWETDPLLRGRIDEFRVWNVARTVEQIRKNLLQRLTGTEPGLVGLWNFDDPAHPGRDASPNHHDGKLVGHARTGEADAGSVPMSSVYGRLTDTAGKPLRGAAVTVMRDEAVVGSAKSGENGDYFVLFAHQTMPYRVLASLETLEAESGETEFVAGGNKLDLSLRDTLRISGTLSDSNGQPRPGVKVEAVSSAGAVAAFSVSDGKGNFVLRRLTDGEYKLRAEGVELDAEKTFTLGAENPLTELNLTLPAAAAPERPPSQNRVLALDGEGAFVNLPVGMFANLRETTIEGWVRFDTRTKLQRFFNYGVLYSDLYLGFERGSSDLVFGTFHPANREGRGHNLTAGDVIEEGRWCHVAVVIDGRETRLYFNGALAKTASGTSSFADLPANSPAQIGRWSDGGTFTGKIDEVRIWAVARTGEEIRSHMFQRLSGTEDGLAALWNFDDPNQPARDATPNGFDGKVVQNATAVPESLPAAASEIARWASLSGATVDGDGRPLGNVKVRLERGDEHFDAETDGIGNFSLLVPGSSEPWRVIATRGDLSATAANLVLDAGEHPLTLKLRDAAPLSGHLQAPDGSPLPTVVVQAVPVGEEGGTGVTPGLMAEIFNAPEMVDFPVMPETVAPTVQRIDSHVDFPLTNGSISGGDTRVTTRFFARWRGRIRIGQEGTYAFHLAANDRARLLIDGKEIVVAAATLTGSTPLAESEKTGELKLTTGDHIFVLEYYNNLGRDGVQLAWTPEGGEKAAVPPEAFFHERAKPVPLTVMSDSRGRFRIPSAPPGRYTLRAQVPGGFASLENGHEVTVEPNQQLVNLDFTLPPFKQGRWKTYTTENGLAGDSVRCVLQAADGTLWFGTHQGVSRFDGRSFSGLPPEDEPPRGGVYLLEEDEAGRIWIGGRKIGLFRYDPKADSPRVRAFTVGDGLPANDVTALTKDNTGRIWVGTSKGLCFFDPTMEKPGSKPFVSTRREPVETVKDLGPGGHDATLMGATRLVDSVPPAQNTPERVPPPGKFLQLDGFNSYVELPPDIFNDLTEATVEGWVKWDRFEGDSRFFDFGGAWQGMNVGQTGTTSRLRLQIWRPGRIEHAISSVPGLLKTDEWTHVAATSGPAGMRLYLNGDLVSTGTFTGSMTAFEQGGHNYLGRNNWRFEPGLDWIRDLKGQMDEVRVWRTQRTEEEIRDGMKQKLTGSEPGLVALWNFDETFSGEREVPLSAQPVSALGATSNGELWIGTDQGVTLFSTEGEHLQVNQTFTSADGLAKGRINAIFEAADGTMWFGTNGGGVSRLDRETDESEVSPEDKPAPKFTTFTTDDGLNDNTISAMAQDSAGVMWFAGGHANQDGTPGLSRYEGQSFVNFGSADGLANDFVQGLHIDSQDGLWIATDAGVSHYDFRSVALLGETEGLDPGPVRNIVSTSDGNVWFRVGNEEAKLSRYDGQRLVKLTRDDGLPGARPADLYIDRDGALLVSDWEAGRPVARFDPGSTAGERIRFELLDGSGPASALARSTTGELWMGRDAGAFVLGQPDELGKAIGPVLVAEPGRDGVMWFVTESESKCSIWRYEPSSTPVSSGTWTEFTDANGLPSDVGNTSVRALLTLEDGSLLAGTMFGARHLDGKQFVAWPSDVSRLQNIRIFHAEHDAQGDLWLATAEGVFHSDGTLWSKLDMRDGLPEDAINQVHRAADGTVWIGGSNKGLARYRPSNQVPRSPILTAQVDRDYIDVAALPTINTGQRVTFKFDVADFYTAVEKRQYRWQLYQGTRDDAELAANWQPPGTVTQLEQKFSEPGAWTLAVQFIDRDLNYSQPTLATFRVAQPWHENRAVIGPAFGVGVALLSWILIARILYGRKRREAQRLRDALLVEEHAARKATERANEELQEARAIAEMAKEVAEHAKWQLETKNEQLSAAKEAADEANQTKSQFLANMSHELRTPMNAIIGYSEMLQEEAEDLDQKGFIPDLQKIHGAGKHLLGLINDILDLSKIEAGKMSLYLEEFDINRLVQEVAATVQPLVTKNANTLVVECPEEIGRMTADVTKVRQTLFNLLSNACKFTERGTIRLRVSPFSAPHGPTLNFTVIDTGIGMTPEQMDQLFQEFTQADASTTRKFGGTGLGLAISRKFCQLMGGDITVDSEVNVGTTFTATLPRKMTDAKSNEPTAEVALTSSPSHARRPQFTVLVIDDDPDVRDLMQRNLVKDGFRVEVAADAERGLELARELRPSAITLDVMLPGMDGWEALAALKANPDTADIPVVMLTIVDNKNMGFALGAADYFTKPIDWHRLSTALTKHRGADDSQNALVIEDDAPTRELVCRILETDGWTVTAAPNGQAGLDHLEEVIPAIIILDLMMPGMDGITFIEELRQRPDCSDVPVIVITAKDLTAEDQQRLKGEASSILQKGQISTEQLLSEVRNLLALRADWYV